MYLRPAGALLAAAAALALPMAAHADVPKARIEGVTDEDLRQKLEAGVGLNDEPPASRFDARRRARQAVEAAIKVLRSEGYYAGTAEPDVGEGERPDAIVRVTPGERFRFTETSIAWQGAPPPDDVRAAALSATGLARGAAGRAEDVVEAEGRVIAALTARGFPDSRVEPREVIVDHAARSVEPTFKIAAGSLVRLDGLALGETGATDPEWLRTLRPWNDGETYKPEMVAELERRLLDTGVYDSVTVALAPPAETTADGLRPVVVSLADRPPRTIELGAGYSTSEGVGVEAALSRYNRLGRGDTLTARTILADIQRRVEAQVSLPHFRRPGLTLQLGTEAFDDATNAYQETGVGVRGQLQQRYGRANFITAGLRFDISRTAEPGRERDFAALTGLGGFALDRSNDALDPTQGWRVDARAEPTLLTGDASLVFVRTTVQGSTYIPFGETAETVVAARARLGAQVGGRIPDVPAGRRFYAGGGGSVRGYEYQAIGPRLPDNTPQGGLSLLETSLELRRRSFGDSGIRQALGAVAFIDAGAVGTEEYPDFGELKVGVGFGLRFDLGFAPVRADFAFPLQAEDGESPFQIYLSLGQAF